MVSRKRWSQVAAAAVMACCGWVNAADELSLSPKMLAEEEPPRPLLMNGLDQIGVGKTLDTYGINLFGWVQASYTTSTSNPPDRTISTYVFNADHQEILLNQIGLVIERKVDVTQGKFDVGGRIEQTYGTDSRFTHSNGLLIYSAGKTGLVKGSSPETQYDINQAYVDFAVPVGNGLLVRVGKWYTLLGYEVVPPTNALFSHSYLFSQAPYTHTGVLAQYALTDEVIVSAGISRGWDQFEDNNGELDFLGQVAYTTGKLAQYLTVSTGPQSPTTSGWRTVLDYIATYQVSDELKLGINADFGWEARKDPIDGSTAVWYGAALYASYQFNSMFTFNGRAEWFNDPDGGAPTSFTGTPNQYYEVTGGVAIAPLPDNKYFSTLLIRPEVRFDIANKAAFDGGSDRYQWTFAVDAVLLF